MRQNTVAVKGFYMFTDSLALIRSRAIFQRAFTLIELVVGMSIMAIVISMFAALILPLSIQSVDPTLQVRATEYAQSVMKEVMVMPFDENTPAGGSQRCQADTSILCTESTALGADAGESRTTFDDVDDFNAYCDTPIDATDMSGSSEGLSGFSLKICVGYDGNYDGVIDTGNSATSQSAKLIHMIVTTPQSNGDTQELHFHAYRSNF